MWTAQCGRRRAGGYSSDIDWRSALTCSKSATDSRCAVASESTGSHGGLPYLSVGESLSGVECALHCTHDAAGVRVRAVAPHTCMSRCLQETAIRSTHARCAQLERPCALLTDGPSVCGKFGLERAFRRQRCRALGSQKLSLQDFTEHSDGARTCSKPGANWSVGAQHEARSLNALQRLPHRGGRRKLAMAGWWVWVESLG